MTGKSFAVKGTGAAAQNDPAMARIGPAGGTRLSVSKTAAAAPAKAGRAKAGPAKAAKKR